MRILFNERAGCVDVPDEIELAGHKLRLVDSLLLAKKAFAGYEPRVRYSCKGHCCHDPLHIELECRPQTAIELGESKGDTK